MKLWKWLKQNGEGIMAIVWFVSFVILIYWSITGYVPYQHIMHSLFHHLP